MNFTPYETFEHGADIGVRGYGRTIEEAFANGARALFSLMVENFEAIEPREETPVSVSAELPDELFVAWLNRLITLSALEHRVFSDFEIKIKGENLQGVARGEALDTEKHLLGIEVKGATFTLAKVAKEGDLWVAQCVVDV
ncbi:archease [Thermosulfurimonas dismutans]|uniref:Archease n=1 Tax=Thermosulfurimonas dismutans TaxID=999894 RepID=A0A179D3N6_9BACT|nr:archease [Thermosulfurimonas dismutans]OAQ20694.1 Archease [Thermosulfurimonas dismutans]